MDQAPKTIGNYLIDAVRMIDHKFGAGYSADHPELVAAFIKASAMDFATAIIAQRLDNLCSSITALKTDFD